MRLRPSSSRPATSSLLFVPLVIGLLAGCGASGAAPTPSSEALPTGLLGPVAPTVGPEALRYVAIGDSYTFGDGVRQMDRWPNQLVRLLRPQLDLDLVNLASRSVASRDVIDEQLPELENADARFVTVQVGANDVCLFHDETPAAYRANMGRILDAVLGFVPADRVVVVTTPDFSILPAVVAKCADEAPEQSDRIRELNDILVEVADERGIAVVDISSIADRMDEDPGLVLADGAYPSAKQYAGWADLVAAAVLRLYREPAGSPEAPVASVSGLTSGVGPATP